MKISSKRLLMTILLGQVAAVVFFLIKTLIQFDSRIIAPMQVDWIVGRVLEDWIRYFVHVCLCSIILGVSVFNSSQGSTNRLSSGKIQGGTLAVLLSVMIVNIALMAFVYGPAKVWQSQAETISREWRQTTEESKKFKNDGDLVRALEKAKLAVRILPEYSEGILLRDSLIRDIDKVRKIHEAKSETPAEGFEAKEAIPYEKLIVKARSYLDEQDYFSALFYLSLAEVERKDDQVVLLMNEARQKATDPSADHENNLKQKRYLLKRAAILELIPLGSFEEAYFKLLEAEKLAVEEGLPLEQAPGIYTDPDSAYLPDEARYADPDVRLWMPMVHKNLVGMGFFKDEIDGVQERQSRGPLVFLNYDKNGFKQYVYFRAIIPAGPLNYFVVKPEILNVDLPGKIQAHWKSEYGKIVDKKLLLKSIDRENQELTEGAVVLTGSVDTNLVNLVTLGFSGHELYGFSGSISASGDLLLTEQIRMFDSLQQAGLDVAGIELSLLDYLVRAFSGISLAILAWVIGRGLRSRYLSKPVMLIILSIPLLIGLILVLMDLYSFGAHSINSALLKQLGFWNAVWVDVGFQAVQLIVCLFVFAGLSAREE